MATIEKRPYEMLVRWDLNTGLIAGAHVKFLTQAKDDVGAVIMQQEGDAECVSMAGVAGFPLGDLLDTLHVTALSTIDEKDAELMKKSADIQAMTADIAMQAEVIKQKYDDAAKDKADIAAKDLLIAELQAQNAAFRAQIPA